MIAEPRMLPKLESRAPAHGATPPIGAAPDARVPLGRRARRWFYHRVLRAFMALHAAALMLTRLLCPRPRKPRAGQPFDILVTGTFYSDNWINAHLRPLAASSECGRLLVVTTFPVKQTDKIVCILPPGWLMRCIGDVPARLLTFAAVAAWRRPHIVGGFHLLINGLFAAVVARLVRARSLYFCVGGPAEVIGGGVSGENRIFSRLETPDPVIERRLIRAVQAFDLVITMGTKAIGYFRQNGVDTTFHVVSGGIDAGQFQQNPRPVTNDLVLVGRLVPIKRIDIFLRAVRLALDELPALRATIVGDGELRAALEALACELRIEHAVTFAGHRTDVADFLQRSRLFVLSSDSEGLALSLMEAMTCGLPAVVSDVGDLGDLVESGVNGFLVERRAPEQFAARIVELLREPRKLAAFSAAARRAACRYQTSYVSQSWGEILHAQR